jgi:tRNA1(Val) A37 N6-methylase TrmN6
MLVDLCGSESSDVSEDAVLGGRLRLRQLREGHRVGHDAILLAAASPGRAGERAADLGAGVGAAGLALASRVEGIQVTLAEIDAELAALARQNVRINGLSDRVSVANLDVSAPFRTHETGGLASGSLDRVLMNPPFNDPVRMRASPNLRRQLAHVGAPGSLAAWTRSASELLRAHGTVTMICRADGLREAVQALASGFGAVAILPIHPRPSKAAIRLIIRASKGSRAPLSLLPGFFLNDDANQPSAEALAVVRDGAVLPLAGI